MTKKMISYNSFSEQGKRENNEDSIFPNDEFEPKTPLLFLVCDGVGGQARGEIASDLVCTQIDSFFSSKNISISDKTTIEEAVKFVEEKFDSNIVVQPETKGMASTMTLLHLHSKGATVAHIGDSRVYQFRKGEILFKTKDHSLVQELFDAKRITEEEMAIHSMRNRITRAIQGTSVKPTEPSVALLTDLKEGDIFLLCSDGVLECFTDEQLKEVFSKSNSENTIAATLVSKCRTESNDNYSAYVIKLEQAYIDSLENKAVEENVENINKEVTEEQEIVPHSSVFFNKKLNLKCKTTKNNVINSYKEDYFFDRKIREDRVLDDLDRLFQN
ncbi:PP2C family protein-serine/threonine phosphatase [Capnocytophaga leadbetteri]|uniref:PP2C family protein-serine/threonine phosphatase n=1 Tax=Capnocytophaga leadbetteri TaxID=327575 RepID=UPI0028D1DB94|nr:protein phosphatase 2C domain-containing protein [Capnocytophaga leadbetteri]